MAIVVSTDDSTSKYCLDVNIVKNEMTANALHVFEVSNKSTRTERAVQQQLPRRL